jgi:hypothetical protein
MNSYLRFEVALVFINVIDIFCFVKLNQAFVTVIWQLEVGFYPEKPLDDWLYIPR